ncbi:MAG TPA: hypothetical protein VFE42_19905 [Chloroflexota bacterium]|nr:hypothetical protein [Chloroflexota bacterium]
MNRTPLYEYKPHEFTPTQKRFLAAAGWATIEAADLLEVVSAVESQRPPEIERVTFLTRELLSRKLFAERRHAYAFARSYVELADIGTDFRLVVWDWE